MECRQATTMDRGICFTILSRSHQMAALDGRRKRRERLNSCDLHCETPQEAYQLDPSWDSSDSRLPALAFTVTSDGAE